MANSVTLEKSWLNELAEEFEKPYFVNLKQNLINEKKIGITHYPPSSLIFSALDHTPFSKVKVVIIGQDPYHGAGQANGLCFSVNKEIRTPPSLVNIYKEINRDLKIEIPKLGDLTTWAQNGVLLLNAILTVRANEPSSHKDLGWENFTDKIIETISNKRQHIVFMLWGNFAKSKKKLIDSSKHLILEAPHPSPFSVNYGFLGCSHFSKANIYLKEKNIEPVNWSLEE